jgi:enoyl-CoA hydratase
VNSHEGIELHTADDIVVVTLSRPHALNAPDRAMHTALTTVWEQVSALDPGAVVLTGSGRAFSAGSDRSLMSALLHDEDVRDEVFAEASRMLLALLDLPMPVVAAVNGPAVGLGCGLAAVCDLVVMADDAYFMDPHVPVGLAGGDGVALCWPPLTGLLIAKEYALLGDRLGAAKALEYGLVNRVTPRDKVVEVALQLAGRLAAQPRQAVRETKFVLNSGVRAHLGSGLPVALSAERRSLGEPENRATLAKAIAPRSG